MFKTGIILAFIFSVGSLTSCNNSENNSNSPESNIRSANTAEASANAAKDNAEELGTLVNLPFEAEDVTWIEESGKLTAVLRFTAEDTRKILVELEKYAPAQPVNLNVERWFPADMIAQSEMNGNNMLNGSSYSAQDFLRPPYSEGKITKIENSDYLILELFAK